MAKDNKRGGKALPFLRIPREVKRSVAYHSVSCPARAALVELIDRYTGINNGFITMSVRDLATALRSSKDTASRALNDLVDAGLAHPVEPGKWQGMRATQWRLTWILCHRTGEPPAANWEPYSSPVGRTRASDIRDTASDIRDTKLATVPVAGRKSQKTQQNGKALSDQKDTYRYTPPPRSDAQHSRAFETLAKIAGTALPSEANEQSLPCSTMRPPAGPSTTEA